MNTIRKKFFNGWLTLCLAVAVLCTPMHVSAVSAPLVDALPTDGDMALSFGEITGMTAYGEYITFTANVYYVNYIKTETANALKTGDKITLRGITYRVTGVDQSSIYLYGTNDQTYRIDKTNDALNRGEGVTITPYREGYYNIYGYAYDEEEGWSKDYAGKILYKSNMRFAMARDAAVRYLSEGYYGEYLTTDGVGFINGVFGREKNGWEMSRFRGWITSVENNMATAVTQEYAE